MRKLADTSVALYHAWDMGNSCGVHLHSSTTSSQNSIDPIVPSLQCLNEISLDLARMAKSNDCNKSHDRPIWWI